MSGLRVSEAEFRSLLVDQLEILNGAEFDSAHASAKRLRTSLDKVLINRGIPQPFLLDQLARSWGISYIDLKVNDVKPQALHLIDEGFARSHGLVPFDIQDGNLKVAMCDPRNHQVLEKLKAKTNLEVIPYFAPENSILRAHLLYQDGLRQMLRQTVLDEASLLLSSQQPKGQAQPAVALLDRLLEYAVLTQASDIHIEPYEHEVLIRCRIDGVLHEVLILPTTSLPPLISRIKILAKMRIDDHRAPQDGSFDADVSQLKFDLRVSSLPTQWGEKVVIRLHPKETITLELEDLGLLAPDYEIMLRNIIRPHGMVLITGPTGCGKSTTLYAALTRLGVEKKYVVNISTIEDPVECNVPRISQVSVNPAAGLTFPSALRSMLRQDPDIIMVGEIRDRDTAEMAVRAALVGRLLLSTLHTNDATGAVARMLDIGVEPFLLASTLTLVVGQRLVRRLCTNCRETTAPNKSVIEALKARSDSSSTIDALQAQNLLGKGADPLTGMRLFKAKGCAQCHGRGFRGRLGIFELFEVSDQIRNMILERRDVGSIRAAAIEAGMKTLFQDGLGKAFLGYTTLEEVTRVAL